MSEVWTQLEGAVVNGTFPLHRCLGSSDHSGVFLTEYPAESLPRAALKLVPAIPTLAESQLSHWHAAAVAHPHLIRLFEAGRCQLRGLQYLYVIMDYAEQNLGQLLQHRPLSEAEVREMLPLTLEALEFLHSKDLVQGQLKPSNILVIDNQLKLASDTIRPAGEATASIGSLSVYNPPEARDGSFSTSGDIWALGVTLCQALTQRPPARSGERGEVVVLPTDFPVSFLDIVRRCLSRNPAQRPSVADLQAWLKPGARVPILSTPAPVGVANPADAKLSGGTRGAVAMTSSGAVPGVTTPGAMTPGATASGTATLGAATPRATASGAPTLGALTPGAVVSGAANPGAAIPGAIAPGASDASAAGGRSPDAESGTRLRIRAVLNSEPAAAEVPERRSAALPILGVVALLALAGIGIYWFVNRSNSGAPGAETAATTAPTVAAQPNVAPPSSSSAPPESAPPTAGQPTSSPPRPAPAAVSPPSSPPSAPPPSISARASSDHAGSTHATADSNSRPSAADTERDLPPGVLHQEIPTVSARSRQTIHGHVRVAVRVTVDKSGTVTSDLLENPGPSKYFARVAGEAASKWKFVPGDGQATRQWLVRFEFSRDGVKAYAVARN